MENQKKEEENYIFAYDEDKFLIKIKLMDIYYIETIKSTHFCVIEHREGSAKLRGDIIHLEEKFGNYFFKIRASTLINVEHVKKIDPDNRLVYFIEREECCCTYTSKIYPELKKILQIRSYRK